MESKVEYFKKRGLGLNNGNTNHEMCAMCGHALHKEILRLNFALGDLRKVKVQKTLWGMKSYMYGKKFTLCPKCIKDIAKQTKEYVEIQEKWEQELVASKI